MPPYFQPRIQAQQWSGVALGMLYLWQFIVAAWSVFVMVWLIVLSQCCEGRPPSLDRASPLAIVVLVANILVFITLLTEVYLLIDDKLTINRNLGIQIGKCVYVGGLWIWRVMVYFKFCPVNGGSCFRDLWRSVLIQTAIYQLPFFVALGYAIFVKVKSARRRTTTHDETPREESPLLAEDFGAPPAEPLP